MFLAISIGYTIGGVKTRGFSLGPVTGSLFAGILIGQFAHVPIAGMAKSFLFLLFLFGIGYSVGPQFLQALKRDGLKPVLLAVVVCVTGLLTAIVIAKGLGLDPGFAAGLVSGALTESPAMGTATEAINALPLMEDERARLGWHTSRWPTLSATSSAPLASSCSAVWWGRDCLASTSLPRVAQAGAGAGHQADSGWGHLCLAQIRAALLPDCGGRAERRTIHRGS